MLEGFDDVTQPARGCCRVRPCYYLLLLYICVAMRGALRVRRARSHHQYPSRPPVRLAPRRLLEGFADVVHRDACSMDDTSPFDAAAAAVVVASYHVLLLYTCDTCDIWRARSLLGRASCPSSSAKARGSRGVMLWVSRSLVGHDNTLTRRRSCRVYMGADIGAFASPATTPPFVFFLSFLFSIAPLAQNRSLRLCQSGALTHDGHKP